MAELRESAGKRWEFGPNIVAIGGGTGLSTMLRGLKAHTKNLTAIVTVADDGGGSGMLRHDLGMPPPGDIRNCMQALANVEPIMEQLLAYRFTEGRLMGQSFGNLLLAALNGIYDSFDQAVAGMSQVLAISGQVLPVTNADVALEAEFENGAHVLGESKIFECKKKQDCRIRRVRLIPERPAALPQTLKAIEEADLVLLGPGSLYTSIIPNLLVDGVAEAIRKTKAPKVYIANIMTQEGETEGYTLSDHIAAVTAHGGRGMIDVALANSCPVPLELRARYEAEYAAPLVLDRERVAAMGIELIEQPLISDTSEYARHCPFRLAKAVMDLYEERADMRIFSDGDRN